MVAIEIPPNLAIPYSENTLEEEAVTIHRHPTILDAKTTTLCEWAGLCLEILRLHLESHVESWSALSEVASASVASPELFTFTTRHGAFNQREAW